ncbi:MAG: recombinase family protein, partial [Armatimonadetes bacterium]|nr:recombinase family protein [Armatimonadota bacterium]
MPQKTTTPVRPRIAVYRRVSTDRQAEEGISLDLQLQRCLEEADRRYGENLYDYTDFCDDGYSGSLGLASQDRRKTKHRPRLSAMMEGVAAGQFECVLVYRIDRLFRSVSLASHLLNSFFRQYEVGLISVQDRIDATTAQGRAMIYVMAIMAEYFLDWMSENIQQALRKLRREGRFIGVVPFGWRRPTDEERAAGAPDIVRDEEQGRWVVQMKDWCLAGWGLRKIIQALYEAGVPTPEGKPYWRQGGVRDVLLNPAHYGHVSVGDGSTVLGSHYDLRYYEEDVYLQVVAQIQKRACVPPANQSSPHYLLHGKLWCRHCGRLMRGRRHNQRGQLYYRCTTHLGDRAEGCSTNSKQTDLVEQCVLQVIAELSQRPDLLDLATAESDELLRREDASLDEEVTRLQGRLREVEQQIAKWSGLFLNSAVPQEVLESESQRLQVERQQVEAALGKAEEARKRKGMRERQLGQVTECLQSFDELWDHLNLEERREFVDTVVDRVDMGRGDDGETVVTVKLHFGDERTFHIPKLHERTGALSLKQLALLELDHRGLDAEQIAKQWQVSPQSVHASGSAIRRRLGVAPLDEAYELHREEIQLYLPWLPLEGRSRAKRPGGKASCLTDAQLDVLRLKAQRKSGRLIAEALGLSTGAVYKHLHDIRQALGARTDKEAVEKARRHGLLADAGVADPQLTRRQKAYLYLRGQGLDEQAIADRWQVQIQSVYT